MKHTQLFKPLFIGAAALMIAFTSCQKDDNSPETETESEVQAAQAIEVEGATASSEAVFIVNTAPAGATRDSITAAEIPAKITAYLDSAYKGYELKKTFKVKVKGTLDSYIAVIRYNDKPIGLKFNAAGDFVQVFEQRERGDLRGPGWKKGGRFDGRDHKHRDTIALGSLAASIKTYFRVTFPGDTLVHAFKAKDNSTVVISVNNGIFATTFNGGDLFMKRVAVIVHKGKKTAIEQTALPAKALTYLSTTYPAYVFNKAFSVKINSNVQAYAVFIDSNNTRLAIHFNAAGDFVKSAAIR